MTKAELVHVEARDAAERLASLLRDAMGHASTRSVNVLGIGSDRTTGDCLGPLVGEFLQGVRGVNVYGTLDAPVHAANMAEIVPEITGFTIAVDAALGSPLGSVSVRKGPLAPGAAFGRQLPQVGNVAVSGLVCEAGPLGFERLRSVRLGFVRHMSQVIATAIATAVSSTLAMPPFPTTEQAPVLLDLAALEAEIQSDRLVAGAGHDLPDLDF